jgi:Mg2+ and Co2+ transporter CorA
MLKRNSTFASYIDKPLRIGYDSLTKLVGIENRFLQIPTILSHTTEVLDELIVLATHQQSQASLSVETARLLASQLKSHRHQCTTYSRTATYLLQRTQATAQLLAETLSFRDQVIAKDQNGAMLRLNKSVVFITTVTLLYLPASFVSVSLPIPSQCWWQSELTLEQSFFGMNFFDMDEQRNRIVATPMIWIYFVVAILLTAATFLFYLWLLLTDSRASTSGSPQSRRSRTRSALKGLWSGELERQSSWMATQNDVELQQAPRNNAPTWSTIGSG